MPKVIIDGVVYRPVAKLTCADVSSIGTCLRAARRDLGLSLGEAADEIGITKSYLWSLEKDRAAPSLLVATKIADAYGFGVATLAEICRACANADDVIAL